MKTNHEAKSEMLSLIRQYGADGALLALSDALKMLGPEWIGDQGAAMDVEAATGHSPYRVDDWRNRAAEIIDAPGAPCDCMVNGPTILGTRVHRDRCGQ